MDDRSERMDDRSERMDDRSERMDDRSERMDDASDARSVPMYGDASVRRSIGDDVYRAHLAYHATLRCFARSSAERARAAGVTPQQHSLLLAIRGHLSYPAVSISDLAQELQISLASTSELVSRAVRRGLLVRRDDATDRRRVLVALSEHGERVLEHVTRMNRRDLRQYGLPSLERICASLRDGP